MGSQPTVRDVARRAGVSLGTISNYLNDTKPIAPATKDRIETAIRELGFIPNAAVRVVLGARSPAIALIIPDGENPFFGDVARGLEDVAVRHGLVVIHCHTNGEAEREAHYSRALAEMRIRAAVIVATPTSDQIVDALRASGARAVTLGTSGREESVASVSMDDFHGGKLGMEHLLGLGERTFVFFGGPAAEPQIAQRIAGCHAALTDAGLPTGALARVDAPGSSASLRLQGAEATLDRLGDDPLAAVFCANDLLAIALESAALRRGLSIPEQVAILGFDDIEGAMTAPVPLSTIRQPRHLLGSAAATLALERDDAFEEMVFSPELVVRESTAPH